MLQLTVESFELKLHFNLNKNLTNYTVVLTTDMHSRAKAVATD